MDINWQECNEKLNELLHLKKEGRKKDDLSVINSTLSFFCSCIINVINGVAVKH